MGSDWKPIRLGEYIEVNDSTYSPREHWPFINYLDTGNITENKVSEVKHLVAGKDKIPSRARRKIRPGDIVYSTVRPNQKHFGLLKNVPENFLVSTGFAVIRGKDTLAYTPFIYWFLAQDHIVNHLHTIGEQSTSAYPSIKPSDIEQLRLEIPSYDHQHAIVHILGSLDDKIELNRQMNRTLEKMAQAIFKSWFIDFDPVRAKAAGRDPGLPKEIADLFPDSFEDSELGEIPNGWEVKTLSSIIELIGGGTPKTKIAEYWNGDIPWFSVVDAPNKSDIWVIDTEKHVTQTGVDNSSTKILPIGTTIISARGTVGKCALVGRPMAMNQSCYGIRPANGYGEISTNFTVRNQIMALQRSGHGSVFNTITRATFDSIRIADGGCEISAAFDKLVYSFVSAILKNLHESSALIRLRDTLLPKLISGELRVPDVDIRIGGVA